MLLNVLLSESSNGEEIGEESRKLALRTLTLCSSPKNVPAVPYYQLEQLEPKLLAFRSLFELAENLVVLKLLEFCNDALLKTVSASEMCLCLS